MAKRSTVPVFKDPRKPSIEESLNLNHQSPQPDDKLVESFIGGAETQSGGKAETAVAAPKNPGGRPALAEEEKKKGIMLYLKDDLRDAIEAVAKQRMMSRNAFIIDCIVTYLNEHQEFKKS